MNSSIKQKNKNPINKKFWQNLWLLLKPFQKKIIWIFSIAAIFETTRILSPYLIKKIIDEIINFDESKIKFIIGLIGIMFIVEVIGSLIHYFKDIKIFSFLVELEKYLPIKLQQKLTSLSLGYHEKENTGNKIIKVQRGVDKLIELLANACWEFWPTITQITFVFLTLLYFKWQVALLFFIFIPIFIVLTIRMNKTINPLRQQRHKKYEESSGLLGQSIINIYTVQSFAQEKQETRKYSQLRNTLAKIANFEFKKMLDYNLLRILVIDIGRTLVILYSTYLAWQNNISLGSLVFFITLSETAYHSLFRLSRTYDRLIESSTGVERITSITKEKNEINNQPKTKKNIKLAGHIIFKNVSFSYNQADKTAAVKNINLEIFPGETIALVGPSGSGKSTLIKLIYRHYDITSGKLLIDHKNIKDYDIFNYRLQLAIVPQEVEIFNTSLKDNIIYGYPKASDKEIKEAIRIANLDFIDELTQGLDTLVGERGVKLSGGQRQRVGIARAIIKKPAILIFDEATSSLDTHSEKLIQQALAKISINQTMIIIAHRLSTIINADKIFVLDKGRIKERGTHQELLQNKDGLYTYLSNLQSLGELK